MPRAARRPPRRLILAILLLSVSVLTLMSMPALGLSAATGPFGRIWVELWARLFGPLAVILWSLLGFVWSAALLARWRRGRLWAATGLAAPWFVCANALALELAAPARPALFGGYLAAHLRAGGYAFFGPGARLHVTIALATATLVLTILMLRWGVPEPFGRAVGVAGERALRAVLRLAAASRRGLAGGARFAWVAGVRPLVGRVVTLGTALRPVGAGRACPNGEARAARPAGGADGGAPPAAVPSPAAAAEPVGAAVGGGRAEPAAARGERPGRRGATSVKRTETVDGDALPSPEGRPARALMSLLAPHEAGGGPVGADEIRANGEVIGRTLESFGIAAEVSEVHPGPVITRYEITPGAGVTISQISSRQDDLALALRAPRIRLLAPIPGKAAVGIEIPNREPALIGFRQIAEAREFQEAPEPLKIALGMDVAGRAYYTSLEKMPHLLVAGTTGSGKSVCINSMIVSLLLRATPEQVRLLLIDPKMLELTTYNDIPHLLKPVLTDAREAARALQWLTREMERRYRVLAGLGVRNIAGYRERRQQRGDEPDMESMPYIVVFVDELADLMMTHPSEVEVPIARLAQMARAVGIHLVLATQRPSVDVITGVIKANFPARIAFQVASRTDSRTILDSNGAEALVGRGDMLFLPPGKGQAQRLHGAYLSERDAELVACFLRQFPPAEPIGQPQETPEEATGPELEDPLFNEALRIVVLSQQGSTSMLQRRLRVGYTRAGRLMDLLERAGIVGPPDGSRARDVLVPADYLEQSAAEREAVSS